MAVAVTVAGAVAVTVTVSLAPALALAESGTALSGGSAAHSCLCFTQLFNVQLGFTESPADMIV